MPGFPRPSPASVVESAYAPEGVIYAWSDDLGDPGKANPKETVACLPDGTCMTTEAKEWATDADCEALAPGLPEKLDALLGELVKAGLDPEFVRGLKVYVLPAYGLDLPGCSEKSVGGLHLGGNSVVVAGLWWDAEKIFLHELGHLLGDEALSTWGYSWTFANEKGREYLKLRGYPKKPTDGLSQAELP